MPLKRDWIATARTLSEAAPHLRRYDGAIVVMKVGGRAMDDDELLSGFARDAVLMKQVGVKPVIVHGGGPMINKTLERLGVVSRFVAGKRVSDERTVEIVEMVLSGCVNKRIVQAVNDHDGRAVGISGRDAGLMVCDQAAPELGFVGTPAELDPSVLFTLLDNGFIPVVAPVGSGRDGAILNVNGDTAAGAIAGSLKADRLLLLTDVDGVLDSSGARLAELTPQDISKLIAEGTVNGGMVPKCETAMEAVRNGVRAAVIFNGRTPNAALLELFTDHGVGSLIRTDSGQ